MDYSYYSGPPSQQFPIYGLNGLPTPEHNSQTSHSDDLQDPFASLGAQHYQSYDPNFRFQHGPQGPFAPPPHSPPESFSKHSVSSNELLNYPTDPNSVDDGDDHLDHSVGRSSSEEKDGRAPAQSKRKAQNRAAQRAFRERKERHVRDLEEKLNNIEEESNSLMADNERLKQELAKFTTENKILRATSNSYTHSGHHHNPAPTTTGPLRYSPTDFYSHIVPNGEPIHRHRVLLCRDTGEKLIDVGATWDLIQGHELFKRGLVDIGDLSERLKGLSQCDGQGPAFREGLVRKAIEESAAASSDELI